MKKTVKHFVPDKDRFGDGVPACDCYSFEAYKHLQAFHDDGEVAKTRRGVTCENCKRTKSFRKVR